MSVGMRFWPIILAQVLLFMATFAPLVVARVSPLSVQVSPFGEVERLKQLIVKFDSAVAAVGDISGEQAQKFVRVVPELAGQWTFRDSQTLVLVPYEGAVKMATTYNVTVQSGIKALDGATLDKEHLAQISTASARVYQFYPDVDQPLPVHPVFVAKYNQRVDTKIAAKLITVTSGLRTYPLRFLSAQQYLETKDASMANVQAGASNWIAFEPIDALPRNATVTVSFGAGCPSLDGLNINSKGRQYQYRTQGDLNLVQSPKGDLRVYDGMPLEFTFDSVLDPARFDKSLVQFDPPVLDYSYEFKGKSLVLKTNLKAATVYHVSFKPGLMDVNGETLGRAISVDVHASSRPPRFICFRNQIILPKGSPPVVSFSAEGMPSVLLSVYEATAQDWEMFRNGAEPFRTFRKRQLLAEKTVPAGPDVTAITADLSPYLKGGSRQFVITAKSANATAADIKDLAIWVQVTGLGVDVFSNDKLIAYVSDIASGEPVKDAAVTLQPGGQSACTDQYGLVCLPLTANYDVVEVTKGDDCAILLPFDQGKQIRPTAPLPKYCFWCVTDRSSYLPGDTVYIKGLLRERDNVPPYSQYKLGQLERIYFSLKCSQKELIKGELPLDRYGAFNLSYAIADAQVPDLLILTLSTQSIQGDTADNNTIAYNTVFRTGASSTDGRVFRTAINVIDPKKLVVAAPQPSASSSLVVAKDLPQRLLKLDGLQTTWVTDKINNWYVSVVDSAGIPVAGIPVKVEIYKQLGLFAKQWLESKSLLSAAKPLRMSFKPLESGLYRIESICPDSKQQEIKHIRDVMSVKEGETLKSEVPPVLSILPSKTLANSGETIKVKIKSPFYPAYGLIIVNAEGIEKVEPIVLKNGPSDFDIKLPLTNLPHVLLKAYVTGGDGQYLVEETKVIISSRARDLQLIASTGSSNPTAGHEEVIDFSVKDCNGKPVKDAQIVASVYRESESTQAPAPWSNIAHIFYPPLTQRLDVSLMRHSLIPRTNKVDGKKINALIYAEQHGFNSSVNTELFNLDPAHFDLTPLMAHRREMNQFARIFKSKPPAAQFDLVHFYPALVTDGAGHASIKVPLNKGDCRYRIRAAAVYGDDSFGMTEVNFGVNKP